MRYQTLKNHQQEEWNAFPFGVAFNSAQYVEMMQKWELDPEQDKKKIASIGYGLYIRKRDLIALKKMSNKHHKELENAIKKDTDGTGFIKDMFLTELINYECGYTGDPEPALSALGLNADRINENSNLLNGFKAAWKEVLNSDPI